MTTALTSENLNDFVRSLEAVLEENVLLKQQNNSLIRLNADLRDNQRRGNELFGKALVEAAKPTKGPQRPNRRKLNRQEVKDIRAAYDGGMRQRDLADNYGVHPATISRLVRGIYH